MLKIRRSRDRLISNMWIPTPENMVFILSWGPGRLPLRMFGNHEHVMEKETRSLLLVFCGENILVTVVGGFTSQSASNVDFFYR